MSRGFIDPSWLDVDEHSSALVRRSVSSLDEVYKKAERKVLSACAFYQINLFDIPLDYTAGTGTISSSDTTVTGVGTAFTTELTVGKLLSVGDEKREIVSISNDTTLTIAAALGNEVTTTSFEYSGSIDTIPLKEYAISLALLYLFRAAWGSGQGQRDIYFEKMQEYKQDVGDSYGMLSKNSILGIYEPATGIPDSPEDLGASSSGYGYI